MRKARGRVAPRVEAVEPRALPSCAPVFAAHWYNAVPAEFGLGAGCLSPVAYGRQPVLPVYQSGLGVGAGMLARWNALAGLNRHLIGGPCGGGSSLPAGRVGLGAGLGAPAVSTDSVTIVNSTGLPITVTATLAGNPRPISRQIANNGSALFDFGSSTGNYITIGIRRSDGLQPPPPSTNNILNRPISGYNGASFRVSVFAGRYSVSV